MTYYVVISGLKIIGSFAAIIFVELGPEVNIR
jgi:hypothetical protein